jgi:hypothetical protein
VDAGTVVGKIAYRAESKSHERVLCRLGIIRA